MRMVSLWRALQLIVVGPSPAGRGSVTGLPSPEFTALDADFFARGAALEDGVVPGADEYDNA